MSQCVSSRLPARHGTKVAPGVQLARRCKLRSRLETGPTLDLCRTALSHQEVCPFSGKERLRTAVAEDEVDCAIVMAGVG